MAKPRIILIEPYARLRKTYRTALRVAMPEVELLESSSPHEVKDLLRMTPDSPTLDVVITEPDPELLGLLVRHQITPILLAADPIVGTDFLTVAKVDGADAVIATVRKALEARGHQFASMANAGIATLGTAQSAAYTTAPSSQVGIFAPEREAVSALPPADPMVREPDCVIVPVAMGEQVCQCGHKALEHEGNCRHEECDCAFLRIAVNPPGIEPKPVVIDVTPRVFGVISETAATSEKSNGNGSPPHPHPPYESTTSSGNGVVDENPELPG
jgi:hypothetical protein